MIAVWPGMGNVAISAGYYLMAKLHMDLLAEFSARELFEVEFIEVKDGLVHTGRLPRSRLFVWRDPLERRDIIVFLGEAQPPSGKYAFCRRLIDFARELGVERVVTFAAMATRMKAGSAPRVFGAAADENSLDDLDQLDVQILRDGRIGGLNGVLLGVAADNALPGACLLGEIPHVFSDLPNPKASLAVIEAFSALAGLEIDTSELALEARAMDEKLIALLTQVKRAIQNRGGDEAEEDAFEAMGAFGEGSGDEDEDEDDHDDEESKDSEQAKSDSAAPSAADEERIQQLFAHAARDRSTAYELKSELDRLGLFAKYEDRFLDLFRKRE